jgi:Tfp pilus assembly PilM family ATPase
MFPRQVLLELQDHGLRGQVVVDGKPEPLSLEAPLPPLTVRNGMPLEKEPLGDLIGDLLVRDGLIDHFVLAALPPAAAQWRVVVWPFQDWPDDPASALRQIAPPLNLPFSLDEAYLDLQPLPGQPTQMLLAAAPKALVDAWVDIFSLAGVQLERLAPSQSCQLAALSDLLEDAPADQLVALLAAEEGSVHRLLLVRAGVPVFERALLSTGEALVDDLVRSISFYRRQDSSVRDVRLLLTEGVPLRPEIEARLSLLAEDITPEPFGSLVLQGLSLPEAQP